MLEEDLFFKSNIYKINDFEDNAFKVVPWAARPWCSADNYYAHHKNNNTLWQFGHSHKNFNNLINNQNQPAHLFNENFSFLMKIFEGGRYKNSDCFPTWTIVR